MNRIRGFAHRTHRARDARLHAREAREQMADFVGAASFDRLIEAPLRDAVEVPARFLERYDHAVLEHQMGRERAAEQQHQITTPTVSNIASRLSIESNDA
jgi:hypothetical protein